MSTRSPERVADPPRLIGNVDRPDTGSPTYTIAPDDAVGYDLMSQWITASTAAVESLESMR